MEQKTDWLDGYDPVAEGEQDERGVDLLGLRASLGMSVADRLRLSTQGANNLFPFVDALRSARHRKAA